MPTTEIAILPLIAGSKPGDPNSQSGKVIHDALTTLNSTDGFQGVHFGPWVEDESMFQLMINWDSIDHHKAFMASLEYGPFLKSLGSIIDGAPKLLHVDFKPEGGLQKALSAPVTELATLTFGSQPDSSYEGDIEKFRQALEKEADGYLGAASGFGYEEVEHEKLEGQKGKAFVAAIGWSSVEAHMAFRETQAFKDNIGLFRNDAKAVEMHHLAALPYAG